MCDAPTGPMRNFSVFVTLLLNLNVNMTVLSPAVWETPVITTFVEASPPLDGA